MKNTPLVILALSLCFACKGHDSEDDAWTTLSNAVDSLYRGNYEAYLNFVDSQDVADIHKDVLILSLKQQYDILSETDSLNCIMDEINSDNDTAEIKYRIIKNSQDTTFCIQKMILSNGKWKIKIK